MRQEQHDRNQLEAEEAAEGVRLMKRHDLIATVAAMMAVGDTAQVIVDFIVRELAPEDGEECPVCGICP